MTYPKLTPILVPGTTTPRYIGERFATVVDVKDFGAKGDGTTDDTQAFTSALAYAGSLAAAARSEDYANPVKVVGRGKFVLSDTVVVPEKNCLSFDVDSIVVNTWNGTSGDPVVYFKNAHSINSLKLDCKHSGCSGIKVESDFCLFEKLTLFGFDVVGIDDNGNGNRYVDAVIMQYNLGENATSSTPFTAIGLRVLGQDSWFQNLVIHRVGIPVETSRQTRGLNIFESCHFVATVLSPTPDSTLVKVYRRCFFINCYFDSGHIDFYYPDGSIIVGGNVYLHPQTNFSSTYPTVVRVFAYIAPDEASVKEPELSISGLVISVGFYDYDGNSFDNAPAKYGLNPLAETSLYHTKREVYSTNVVNSVWHAKEYVGNSPFVEWYKVDEEEVFKTIYADGSACIVPGTSGKVIINGVPANSYTPRLVFSEKQTGIGARNQGKNLFIGSDSYPQCVEVADSSNAFQPIQTNTTSLGSASNLWKEIFCSSATISTSDLRVKDNIGSISDDVFAAWSKVSFNFFQFKESIKKKGKDARLHVGFIAQNIKEAFESQGLDAFKYGLLCYDEWEDEYEQKVIVDKEAERDENGYVVKEAVTHNEPVLLRKAGNMYSLRYEECLCLEAAYQRKCISDIVKTVNDLENKVKSLEPGEQR